MKQSQRFAKVLRAFSGCIPKLIAVSETQREAKVTIKRGAAMNRDKKKRDAKRRLVRLVWRVRWVESR